MIGGVTKVGIEVEDQDRAKKFWVETLGFPLVQDSPYKEDQRWLEVRTPDGAIVVGLHVRDGGAPVPVGDSLPTSNVWFYSDDVQAAHRELSERGVEFPQPPMQLPGVGWWAIFADPDGNRFALLDRA
jgi:predicted enzyme related to lactoylglutathione lyase